MARAPARLAPSIKAWLRGFNLGSVTVAISSFSDTPNYRR
jgi:hypothetical protein